MAIIRESIELDSHFTTIPNAWLRDGRISLKARGLLAMILSHRVGWRITLASLAKQNPEGRDAITSAIKELEEYGYMKRRRTHDERGKFAGFDYILTSEPFSENPHMYADYPNTVNRIRVNRIRVIRPLRKLLAKKNKKKKTIFKNRRQAPGRGRGNSSPPSPPPPTRTSGHQPPRKTLPTTSTTPPASNPLHGHPQNHRTPTQRRQSPHRARPSRGNPYRNGRPITLTTLGQAVDGYQRQDPYQSAAEKQQQMAQVYQSLKAQTYPAPPPVIGPYTLEETPY